MKHIKKLLMIAIAFVLLLPTSVYAEKGGNDSSYSYTVKLYAGNHGTFSDGSTYKTYTVDDDGKPLTYGSRITLSTNDIVLNSEDGGKYYVRGIRETGKDNDTVSSEKSFKVTSDREYVVAYGIAGNMVAYTVNYVDSNGNALAESETYYGVVGDKPVVAYLYVDGYQPQAYNLTKTLSSDESSNVFTFTYTIKPQPTETVIDEGTTNNGRTNTSSSNTSTNNNTTTNNSNTTDSSSTTTDNNTTVNEETNSNEDDSNVDENGVQDIVDLDENETPLENINVDDDSTDKNMLVYIGVAVVAIAALCGFLFFVFKKKKKEENKQ